MPASAMTFPSLSLQSLKRAKNSVIGNPSAKLALAQDEDFIEALVSCLDDRSLSFEGGGSIDDIRIEAAHVISSLSYGSHESLKCLLRVNTLDAFLLAISRLQPSSSAALRLALTRAIRTLGVAVADIVGPPQWGLQPENSDLREDAESVLNFFFRVDFLDVYLPLLVDPSPQTSASVAQLLANAVRSKTHKAAVTEWLPPADRLKEMKGKRGWEVPSATKQNSPSRLGGWVVRNLTALLRSRDSKLQEAALSSLAALANQNPSIAVVLAKEPPDREIPSTLSTVLSLSKSRSAGVQLAACLCATHIIRANPSNPSTTSDPSPVLTILQVVNRIMPSSTDTLLAKTKACFILRYLVKDDTELCRTAYEQGSLKKAVTLAIAITPLEERSEWDKDEPESISSLREGALMAIATICLFENDIRREVAERLHLIPVIQSSLLDKRVGVRYAACQCVRVLTRGVAAIRTSIVDSGLGLLVFDIFKKEHEDHRVVSAALLAVCNIVNNFSPLQPKLLERGFLPRIVQVLASGDSDMRRNALWAVKNLLCISTLELKTNTMSHIGWQALVDLLQDPNVLIQEQAWNIVCNLAKDEEGVELVVREMGADVLFHSLLGGLGSSEENVVLQAMSTLANLATGNDDDKAFMFGNQQMLSCVRACLSEFKVEVRRQAVGWVLELAKADPKKARRQFNEAGIISTLKHICECTPGVSLSPGGRTGSHQWHMFVEDDREVIDRARQALNILEHGGIEFDT